MTNQPRILIIDDDLTVAKAMSLTFERGNFGEVVTVTSAEEAFDLLELEAEDTGPPGFDVILLDVMMPGIDGIKACARIRVTRRYRNVPILMCSGLTEVESLNQAFVAGAHDFLTKPVSNIELLARTRSALRLKRELDRRRAREEQLREESRRTHGDDASLMDSKLGFPSKAAFELTVRLAVGHDGEYGLLALRMAETELMSREHGEGVLEEAIRRVALTLAGLEAPLGWMFFSHGGGLFFIMAPHMSTERMALYGDTARKSVAAIKLNDLDPHGVKPIELKIAAGEGQGSDLLTLPAQLIRAVYGAEAVGIVTDIKEQAA